jgi:hypothetical protein
MTGGRPTRQEGGALGLHVHALQGDNDKIA